MKLQVSLAVLASFVLVGTGFTPGATSAAADPVGDCAVAFPVDQLAEGDPLTGLTTAEGTVPTDFEGRVVDIVEDGVAPGVDLVMAELTSPEIDRFGVWQGMSGSPVYAADGRLVGAVSRGPARGPASLAGITPYESMEAALPGARTGSAPALRPAGAATGRPYLGRGDAVFASETDGAPATVDDVVAGGNLVTAITHGDDTLAGSGTVTSVCDGRVMAFGHEFNLDGPTGLSLHPAATVAVQERPGRRSLEVVAVAGPVGTLLANVATGVAGAFGAIPRSTEITSTVSYRDRSGESTSFSNLAAYNPGATARTLAANLDRVVEGFITGVESQTLRVTGTDEDAEPFTLRYTDLYSTFTEGYSSISDIRGIVFGLGRHRGVRVDSIEITSEVTDGDDRLTLTRVEQRRHGAWHRVFRNRAAYGRPGESLRLRATLTDASGEESRTRLQAQVPRRPAPGTYFLEVQGGNAGSNLGDSAPYLNSLHKVLAALRTRARNDQVVTRVFSYDDARRGREDASRAQGLLVDGLQTAVLVIR